MTAGMTTNRAAGGAASRFKIEPGTYAARLIRATLRDAERLFDEALAAGSERRPGAGITALDDWMRAHPRAEFVYGAVFSANLETLERLLRSCTDLAEGLALALEANGRVISSLYVLERALGEGVMRACYLLDASVPPARTVARMAAFQIESIEGNLPAALAFGPHAEEEAAKARKSIAELHQMMSAGGFDLHLDKNDLYTISVGIDGQRESMKFNATDAFAKYLPASAWQWQIGSGVTHSRDWMLASIVSSTEADAPGTMMDSVAGITTSVFELVDALARVAELHAGFDADWFFAKVHLRRRGMLSWTKGHRDVAVNHKEYAARPPGFRARPAQIGQSFLRYPGAQSERADTL